ncbi:amidohydrolase family protein [Pseudomonas sp. BN606]|uniref:amidohydrolase family protein n=1 Tax=Pseudomonas sp. BN606 TaxID=2567894 RepID=UPI002454F896|nr:amidohydrolase family protein [Pseudomonas sp. BN606]MDH4654882.1 amidohydrolase [Pseudomonas sp. BN606]
MYKPTRRSFLATASTAVAATAIGAAGLTKAQGNSHEENGSVCNCGLIDVHTHYLPPLYAQALADAGLVKLDGGFPVPKWSEQAALDHMAKHNIDAVMLSVTSPSVGFLKERAARRKMARYLNEFAADVVKRNPGRFGAFATLPMEDLDDAMTELEYALDHLKLDGVIVESNTDGVYLGNPKLDPLFAALDKRNSTLFLHPTSPACFESVGLGRPAPILEFPMDTARTVTDLLFAGTLTRYPNIRMIVPHAGGALPALAHRIAMFSTLPFLEKKPAGGAEEVRKVLSSLYYDLAGSAHDGAVESLRRLTSTSHILFGSDFPFTPPAGVDANVKGVRNLKGLTIAEHEGIARSNARSLFPRLGERSAKSA